MKMFGLTAIAAVAAMAFVGAGTASAGSTQLCKVVTSPCPAGQAVTTFSGKAIGDAILLDDLAPVLCLHVLGTFNALALGAPQELHPTSMTILSCGVNAAHNSCVVTVIKAPLFLLLRTAANLGTVEGHGGEINVKCTILGFIKLDCTYAAQLGIAVSGEGGLHSAGAGHGRFNLINTPAELTVGGGLCPTKSTLDATFEADTHIFISS